MWPRYVPLGMDFLERCTFDATAEDGTRLYSLVGVAHAADKNYSWAYHLVRTGRVRVAAVIRKRLYIDAAAVESLAKHGPGPIGRHTAPGVLVRSPQPPAEVEARIKAHAERVARRG